ncbi:Zinc finger and BTB domain-containing protein 8A [Desmophyllum pertusum]|uniref:Zinc finger and BTB domain-containing protein 8A n=1 Tax=Desmophyllum pertusum TaxID=174260 RepID=A0A9X0CXT1_9CNID|nr:Zinc finger and BTB domain-containing protein 8A [Desmophyllum pertusum]
MDRRGPWYRSPSGRTLQMDPPEGGKYPEEFLCPFRGCVTKVTRGEECAKHIQDAGYPKKDNDKNWVCRGDDKAFTTLDGLRSHINTVHLPKRFVCNSCIYKTNVGGAFISSHKEVPRPHSDRFDRRSKFAQSSF